MWIGTGIIRGVSVPWCECRVRGRSTTIAVGVQVGAWPCNAASRRTGASGGFALLSRNRSRGSPARISERGAVSTLSTTDFFRGGGKSAGATMPPPAAPPARPRASAPCALLAGEEKLRRARFAHFFARSVVWTLGIGSAGAELRCRGHGGHVDWVSGHEDSLR